MKFEDKFLSINNQTYHVKIHGSGRPLIALHGFSESADTWDKLDIPGYQIFAVDFLGHGQSDKPTNFMAYLLFPLLDSLSKIIQELTQNQPYSLLGYSMGGRFALQYALDYPDEPIEHLILESASAGISDENERERRRYSDEALAQKISQNGSVWFADFWGNLPLFATQKKLPLDIQQEIWQRRAANEPRALAQTLRCTGQGVFPPARARLGELTCPIFYISGKLDFKYSRLAEQVFSGHEQLRSVSLQGLGHNTHLEKPNLYNQILTEYFAARGAR